MAKKRKTAKPVNVPPKAAVGVAIAIMASPPYKRPNAAAVEATSAALDAAAARPFSVVLSVDEATKAWLSAVLLIAAVVGVVAARLK